MNKIISLEGGWAGGKTSILKLFDKNGFETNPSVVPQIYDLKGRDNYSPRKDAEDFTRLFLKLKDGQVEENFYTNTDNIAFFDRVFFAPIVLRKFLGLSVPTKFYDIAKKAEIFKTVFLVEPIPIEYHKNGWPREHFTYEDALRYHTITESVIKELGFDVYKVKFNPSIEARANDILNHINKYNSENYDRYKITFGSKD